MAKPWTEIEASSEYRNLDVDTRGRLKKEYWNNVVAPKMNKANIDRKSMDKDYEQFTGEKAPLKRGERNIWGNIFERPQKAIKGAMEGVLNPRPGESRYASAERGFERGSNYPEEMRDFRTMGKDEAQNRLGKFMANRLPQQGPFAPNRGMGQALTTGVVGAGSSLAEIAGIGGDFVSNPAMIATSLAQAVAAPYVAATTFGKAMIKFGGKEFAPLKWSKETMARYGKRYLPDNVLPRVIDSITKNVNQFTKPIQEYAIKKLKIPANAVRTIAKKGVRYVNERRQALGDNLDSVYKKVLGGFANKHKEAGNLFDRGWAEIPDGALFSPKNTHNTVKNLLVDNGLLNPKTGLYTEAAKNPAVRDATLGKVMHVYDLLKPKPSKILTAKGVPVVNLNQSGTISKETFRLVKSTLDDINPNHSSYVQFVRPIRNSVYDDLGESGAKSLKNARIYYKKVMEMEDKYMTSKGDIMLGEKKLDTFHKMSRKQVEDLREVENYIGSSFVDDVESVTAARFMDRFELMRPDTVLKDLEGAVASGAKKINLVRKQYSPLLGKDTSKTFFDLHKYANALRNKKIGKWAGVGLTGALMYEGGRRALGNISGGGGGGETNYNK